MRREEGNLFFTAWYDQNFSKKQLFNRLNFQDKKSLIVMLFFLDQIAEKGKKWLNVIFY